MIATSNSLSDDSPIFLVGFMGAGKTTVGRALARHLRYDFSDLDELIEKQAGKSIQAIFAELGESGFRRIEREAIQSCREMVRAVIALGGGAYVSAENRTSLRAIGKTVWLDCPLEVCLRRIGGDRSRPLLGDEAQMKTLLEQRRSAYEKADYVVHAAELSTDELAAEIAEIVRTHLAE
ncbi:MAG: shikimate kinase [Acidobacteriota bacterium]